MSELFNTAQQFKRRLVSRERAESSELLRAYALAYRRIAERVAVLTKEIEQRRLAGETVSQSFLYERDRLALLLAEVERELARFSDFATVKTTAAQAHEVESGARDALVLVELETGVLGTGIARRAAEAIAGHAADGSPLRALFDAAGASVSQKVRDELVVGVAQTTPARVVAARVQSAAALGLSRSLTIARTETLRAYREASHDIFDEQKDVLAGWVWLAALSPVTCAVCIAMHGRIFPLSHRFASHPNCSCVAAPVTHGAEKIETGVEWFARQDNGLQKSVLGAAKFHAFDKGALTLPDLVGEHHSPQWGLSRFEKPLRDVVAT